MGDCFGRETVRTKEEEEEGGRSARTKRSWPGVRSLSSVTGHDHSSVPIAATRREQTERGAVKGHRMVRCWKHPADRLEEAQCRDGDSAASSQSHFPHKAFWVSLSASLLLVIVTLGLTGHLGLSQSSQSSQIVRITVPDQTGVLINQSAVVDQQNDLVTFLVTSPANKTSAVLFDVKHGLICYKPVDQESCFLQKMEKSDYDNVRSLLHESTHKQSQFQLSGNETHRQMEFLGVLGASQVDVSTLEEPVQALCQDRSVHWTRRTEGPGKQRLVYFCIDICFPSNICVSVCFYYLPE